MWRALAGVFAWRWEMTPEAGFCFSCYAPAVPERVAIFIDGGYLDHVLRDLELFGKVDYRAFAAALTGPNDLLRAYSYHCLPYQSAHPTAEESQRFASMQKFLAAIERTPRFMVRQGRSPTGARGKTAAPYSSRSKLTYSSPQTLSF